MYTGEKEGHSFLFDYLFFAYTTPTSNPPNTILTLRNIILHHTQSLSSMISKFQQWLPRRRLNIFGKDSLIMSSLPYYTLAMLTAIGVFTDPKENTSIAFILITVVYAFFPILDELFSLDSRNPTPEERRKLERDDGYFRMTLYLAMILSWVINIKICVAHMTYQLSWGIIPVQLSRIFMVSNLYSVQFAVAHEVMHKPGRFYRILATLHMTNLYYTHFTYHHLYTHHHLVSTPLDPSSAPKGQNVYSFIYKCVVGSLKGVYDEEKKNGKGFFMNYAVWSVAGSLAFAGLIYLVFGLQALIVHSLTAFGAIIYLEAINYIEHYGLQRRKLPNGEYEKVTILHSWNAPHRFTNYLLFKLQRHSDHHENSSKPFQTLVSMQQSPFLPHGYTLMILMSFFPKVWFRIMDPLAQAYQKLDADKGERISPQVTEVAQRQTRKFLIQIALSTLLPIVLMVAKVI